MPAQAMPGLGFRVLEFGIWRLRSGVLGVWVWSLGLWGTGSGFRVLWGFPASGSMWVVVKIMVPFWVLNKDPKRDHNFDNHPRVGMSV